jgi:transcription elongation factor GreB
LYIMSKAFLRESDFAEGPDLPPPISLLPPGAKNYMTSHGAEQLRQQLSRLTQEERPPLLAESINDPEAKRDLQLLDQRIRHLRESLATAEVVPAPSDATDVVRFGARVSVRESSGDISRYRLVGVDESDPEQGLVSWTSPLARALLNARRGERVKFSTPSGAKELEIVDIDYESNG